MDAYEVTSTQDLQESAWFAFLLDRLRIQVEEAKAKTERLIDLCRQPEGPIFYEKGLQQDLLLYEDILAFDEKMRFYDAFRDLKYGAIGRKPRGYDGDEVLLNRVKDGREAIKKSMEKALFGNWCV